MKRSHHCCSEQGSSVLVVMILLAAMVIMVLANSAVLHMLDQELKQIERQQQKKYGQSPHH